MNQRMSLTWIICAPLFIVFVLAASVFQQYLYDLNQEIDDAYADIQQQILRTAVRMLRPGGMLLYSTCTFSTEEDEENVRKLLAQDPALSLVPIAPRPGFSDGKIPGTVKLWPHKIHGEGHFL